MKNVIKLLSVLLVLLFGLSSCADVVTSPKAPASSLGEASEESAPALSTEELTAIREQAFTYMNGLKKWSVHSSRLTQKAFSKACAAGEYTQWQYGFLNETERRITAISDRTVFPAPEAGAQVKEGMLLNEVLDLLGQPDLNAHAYIPNNAYMGGGYETMDYYLMYLMNDGRFLTIRFVPAFIGEYGREVMAEAIEDFESYEKEARRYEEPFWGKVKTVSMMSLEELYALPLAGKEWGSKDFFLRTAEEDMPPYVAKKGLMEQVLVNMSYDEVKELLGSCGREYGVSYFIDDAGERQMQYVYFWKGKDQSWSSSMTVLFELTDTGELIVAKTEIN